MGGDGELECARNQLQRKTSTFDGCAALSMLSAMSERGYCKKDFKNKYVRSWNVYENKQNHDKMPGKSRTFSSNRHEFCRNSG